MNERGLCQRFVTGILIISTFVYLIIGLIVIGLTLWLRLDSRFEEMMRANILRINNNNAEMDEIKEQIRFGLTITFWVICGCGFATALIGLLGTCGAILTNRVILILNLITSLILMAIEIVIIVFIFLYKPMVCLISIKFFDNLN
uniref:Uncharacterized protein n=1 Tax=Onchocerca volvulus TaxID=6282 RepID=A0A8R1Y5M2_ONCVO